MTKTLNKLVTEWNLFSLMKDICGQTYGEHFNGERMNDNPLRSEVARMSVLVSSVQQEVLFSALGI